LRMMEPRGRFSLTAARGKRKMPPGLTSPARRRPERGRSNNAYGIGPGEENPMHTSVAVVLVAGLVGQPADAPPFVRDFAPTTTFYYKSPDPALGPKLLKEWLKKENIESPWFAKREDILTLFGAQLGDMARGKPKIVREYEAAYADAPAPGRRVILQALRNCGDKETVKQIEAWLADPQVGDVRPELVALKKDLEDPARKHVRDRPAREPRDL